MENFAMRTEYNVNFQPNFTKKDLRTGMFGLSDDGCWFIVAGENLVFQNGTSYPISCMNENMEFPNWKIKEVYKNCSSFNDAKDGLGTRIYPAQLPKLTLEEIKEKLGFDFELVDKK